MDSKSISCRVEVEEKEDRSTLYLYGTILSEPPKKDPITGEDYEKQVIYPELVREKVSSCKKDKLELHINSYGGSVYASIAIYNILKQSKKEITVFIDGIAASGASIIAMAGNKVIMPHNTQLMIHRASTFGFGNADDMLKMAESLEQVDKLVIETYKPRFKGGEEELKELIYKETYLSAQDSLNYGLCDEVIDYKKEAEDGKPLDENGKKIENTINKLSEEGTNFLNGFINIF